MAAPPWSLDSCAALWGKTIALDDAADDTSPSSFFEGASLLEASARLPVAALTVASSLGLSDVIACSRCDQNAWRGRLRWRVALAASRDPLWATLALEEDPTGASNAPLLPANCSSGGAVSSSSRPSLASAEVLRCSESAEIDGCRPSFIRALSERSAPDLFEQRRPEAIAALVQRISRRQPWRFLEVEDVPQQHSSHPILALLASGRPLDGPVEDTLAILTDPLVLEEAGIQREHRLSANPAPCDHRAVCSVGPRCGRVEAYPGQFIACTLCDEVLYCSVRCRLIHWSAGHQATCRGVLAATVEGSHERIEREEAALVEAAEAEASSIQGSSESRADVSGRPCPHCAKERRRLIAPFTAAAALALDGAWGGDWHALGAWPRQPPVVLALASAASELLEVAAAEQSSNFVDRSASEIWADFRQRAMRDAHTLVAQMHSFPDAIAAGNMPAWVWKHAEARVRAELGPMKDTWRVAARRAAPVGGRAAEALAGWLVAILKAAAEIPALPSRERLRTVAGYRRLDVEALMTLTCCKRPFSPALVRVLGCLAAFVDIPANLLLRHVDLGGSPDAAELLLQQHWVPRCGLDSAVLAQVCQMQSASAPLIESLAARTTPDVVGLRALHRLSGELGARGQVARVAAAQWAKELPREGVEEVVKNTALEVPELPIESFSQGSELPYLEALTEALAAPWLEGLRLQGDTAKHVYARRPLTADSVRVVRLATRGMETEEVEALLADVEPCLVRHDSRGVVALLDWIGRGEARPVFIRLLHGLLQTAPLAAAKPREPAAAPSATPSSRPIMDAHRRTPEVAGSYERRMHPPKHSRASVEAVEELLTACPRLARSTLPLEQLGLLPIATACGSENNGVDNTAGNIGNGTGVGSDTSSSSSGTTGLGRLLPLQTLCLCCESPDPHTALIAKALLRRSPEARDHPLPRALRRNARGSKYSVFVCNAATCLQHKRLAAEEAGEDSACLSKLQEIFTNSTPSASSSTPRSKATQSTPTQVSSPQLVVPPSLSLAKPTPRENGREGGNLQATSPPQPLRPPRDPPPPRRSPRPGRHAETPRLAAPPTLCQALAIRAARRLPALRGSPHQEAPAQWCDAARDAGIASALPVIHA